MLLEKAQTRDAARIVDAAVARSVLVFGSPPGAGRDLDVLVRDADLGRLRNTLAFEGFVDRADEWVRFRDCTAEAIDLVPASSWSLPERELDELFAEARAIPGFERLLRPAPHHALLILARLTGTGGGLPAKRRRRIESALTEDAGAWERAREHAGAWRLETELARLQRAFAGAGPSRRHLPRLRRARVVALSGIDGSGKSSQARALRDALERLGYDAAVEWTPFGQNAWLNVIGRPVKGVLRRLGRFATVEPSGETGLERTPGTVLRERRPLVNFAWSAVVTFANGLAQLRTIVGHTRHGRIVVYDRYALDSTVQLRFRYGPERRFRLQRGLIALLAPRPIAAFYLDIPAEASLARKDDRWTLDDLSTQTRLYGEEHARAGVVRLDGLRPADELAAVIGEAVWRALD